MNTADDVLERIKAQGRKLTDTRKQTIELIFSVGRPVSAPELLLLLAKQGLEINKTTLYRELEFLLAQDVLVEVRLDSYVVHYEPASLPHHHHLVCDHCGEIEEVRSQSVEQSLQALQSEVAGQGFVVERHTLEFYGRCHDCH